MLGESTQRCCKGKLRQGPCNGMDHQPDLPEGDESWEQQIGCCVPRPHAGVEGEEGKGQKVRQILVVAVNPPKPCVCPATHALRTCSIWLHTC